jgi:hypothetical protein
LVHLAVVTAGDPLVAASQAVLASLASERSFAFTASGHPGYRLTGIQGWALRAVGRQVPDSS